VVSSLRQWAGCWLSERWRAECALSSRLSALTGISWLDVRNRGERLVVGSDAEARVCQWQFSSMLTVARVFPEVGGRLLLRAAEAWPFAIEPRPIECAEPRVSILIPVGGRDRLPQFQAVVKAFWAQSVRDLEIIAVEHAPVREYEAQCPAGVRYLHLERKPGEAFNKSRALNAGARAAKGSILILHDGDILVPVEYVRSAVARVDAGFDGLQPLRLLFYLDQAVTGEILDGHLRLPGAVQSVGHNFPGGSTVASASAYWAIGGSDERFEQRGGDDNDFLDRLKTRRFYCGGYLPGVHLWHPTDPSFENSPQMRAFKAQQLVKSPHVRIAELLRREVDVQKDVQG
jgi:hypothetical protein